MKNTSVTISICTLMALITASTAGVLFYKTNTIANEINRHMETERQTAAELNRISSMSNKQDALIELASNNRMASIVAYHLKNGETLTSLSDSGYLTNLSQTLKSDFIYDNVYGRLAAFNAHVEYTPISSSERLIRGIWKVGIEIGSHFDIRPQGRLILSSESVPIPLCKTSYQPYVAYVVASPVGSSIAIPTVAIVEESGRVPLYRFSLKGAQLTKFDTSYRILVDVGCTPEQSVEDQSQMTN